MIKNKKFALISVSDKSNLEGIVKYLVENNFQIISTGGTFKKLKELSLPVLSITEITKFPEIMDGRVKTLHPNIHAGLLARETDEDILNDLNIQRINVLIVNFYPFEKTVNKNKVIFEEEIEDIDIGGPAMVRAGSKNFENCCVLTDPSDYEKFIHEFDPELISNKNLNRNMALKAFEHVANYDISIANYLGKEIGGENFPKYQSLKKINNLRYGENPHQTASLYQNNAVRSISIVNSKQYQGKDLSFNNIVDGDSALSCVVYYEEPTCVIVKHANPCGVCCHSDLIKAYEGAYNTDPTSSFGGVIAFNKEVNEDVIKKILDNQFVELIIAPSFSKEALKYAESKINIRIIEFTDYKKQNNQSYNQIKSISDGILMQDEDYSPQDIIKNYKVVSKKIPTAEELSDLYFSWIVSKYVKSNAIVFSKERKTLGIGAGQMSRIDSTFIAAQKALQQNLSLKNAVMASDAFFPFPDNVEKAAELGI